MTNQPIDAGEGGISPALAHVSEDGRCHLLRDHLVGTAAVAVEFAKS